MTTGMDTAAENRQIIAEVVAAMQEGDMESLGLLVADDLVWTVPGNNPSSGVYRGLDQFLGVIGRLAGLSEGSFSWDVRSIDGDDDGGMIKLRTRAARNGRCIEYDNAVRIRVRNGRVVEGSDRFDDQPFVDEFWN